VLGPPAAESIEGLGTQPNLRAALGAAVRGRQIRRAA
jgi:hypothetical protein